MPPQSGELDCTPRKKCIYPDSGVPEHSFCHAVCADEQGNCPPIESVCSPFGSCERASDCQGDLPSDCTLCPLSLDGTVTVACPRWGCDGGTCAVVRGCELGSEPVCAAGSGCPAYYLHPDKGCTQDSDCVVATHRESCCDTRSIGVARRSEAAFAAAEAECMATSAFPFCGCPPGETDENGMGVELGQQVEAVCESGSCKAIRGPFACGATTCAGEESCCVTADSAGKCSYMCTSTCASPPPVCTWG